MAGRTGCVIYLSSELYISKNRLSRYFNSFLYPTDYLGTPQEFEEYEKEKATLKAAEIEAHTLWLYYHHSVLFVLMTLLVFFYCFLLRQLVLKVPEVTEVLMYLIFCFYNQLLPV